MMSNKSETDTNYINSVNHISNYLGIKELAISIQTKKIPNSALAKVKKILSEKFINNFNSVFFNHDLDTKLRTYKLVKKHYNCEMCITKINNFKLRQSLAKLRLFDHFLPIETDRKLNITSMNRFCTICNQNKIGDEFHFILECTNKANNKKKTKENQQYLMAYM